MQKIISSNQSVLVARHSLVLISAMVSLLAQSELVIAADSTAIAPPTGLRLMTLCPRVLLNGQSLTQVTAGIPAANLNCSPPVAGGYTAVGAGTLFGAVIWVPYNTVSNAQCPVGQVVADVQYDVTFSGSTYKSQVTVTCCSMPLNAQVYYQWGTLTPFTDPTTGAQGFSCN